MEAENKTYPDQKDKNIRYPYSYVDDNFDNPYEYRKINWRKYLYLILSNWYWFLIVLFISLLLAFIKIRYTLPQYKVTSTLIIEDESNTNDVLGELRSIRFYRRRSDLSNESAKLRAFSLHKRTIDSLGWNSEWIGLGRVARKRPLYQNIPFNIDINPDSDNWYLGVPFTLSLQNDKIMFSGGDFDTIFMLNQWIDLNRWLFRITKNANNLGHSGYNFTIYDPNILAIKFRNKISIEVDEEEGSLIRISSQGPIMKQEIEYINALCENYIETGLERKRQIAENSFDFVEEQISIIQDSLNKTERQLLSYQVNNKVVDINKEGQIAYNKLEEFYRQKTDMRLKYNYYKYIYEYIENKKDPQAIIAPAIVDENDQLLLDQVKVLQDLYIERENLAFSVSENNPGLIQINTQIQNLRTKILEIISGLMSNTQLAIDQIEIEEKQIEEQLLYLPANEQALQNIRRKYDINNEFYTYLLQKRAEVGIQKASTISAARILDEANIYNSILVSTNNPLIIVLAILIGLFLPFLVIYLIDYLDPRIKTRDDIENKTNLPIIGTVSHTRTKDPVPVHRQPSTSFSETFRHIRTNIDYLSDSKCKSIMVTSAISGEGKTFIATNLAAIFSMKQSKVILVGLDLRKPSLHRTFNIDNKSGITTYLSGESSLDEVIISTQIPFLDILTAGPVPPNPSELIESSKFKDMFVSLKKRYDYIIIDTPPIALVTDAILIGKHTDINIFVIRQNYSTKDVLKFIAKLSSSNLNSPNLLINDLKQSKTMGYYYSGYGYGYGYSYGYKYSEYEKYFNEED